MSEPRYFALVPAAGAGRRMGAATPKQYLALRGRPVIEHTLERLAAHPRLSGLVVVLARDDRAWARVTPPAGCRLMAAAGGEERCHSVLSGLATLLGAARAQDRVLVHDAVRPCLRGEDIGRLIETVGEDPSGGLLALPVRDTMKRANAEDEAIETVPREHLWHALTPQLFPLGALAEALRAALASGRKPTDEAQAMELAGYRPRLVEGHPDNIKITRAPDLALAELYLAEQERTA